MNSHLFLPNKRIILNSVGMLYVVLAPLFHEFQFENPWMTWTICVSVWRKWTIRLKCSCTVIIMLVVSYSFVILIRVQLVCDVQITRVWCDVLKTEILWVYQNMQILWKRHISTIFLGCFFLHTHFWLGVFRAELKNRIGPIKNVFKLIGIGYPKPNPLIFISCRAEVVQ